MDISNYLKAGYPALYIVTREPLRATATLNIDGWQSFSWDCLRGITESESGKIVEDVIDPPGAVKWLGSQNDTVLLVQNFHHFVSSVEIIQEIQNSIAIWKASGCCLLIVGPPFQLPQEIACFFTRLEFRLPTRDALYAI